MTDVRPLSHSNRAARSQGFLYAYMCLFIVLLFFRNSEVAAEWVLRGLLLCAKRLIPSLFPFMVVSSLVVSSGLGASLSKVLRTPIRIAFGLGEECACACLLGWLCGFPLGARCASALYEDGRISAEEYGRVLCVCSTPSPAFLISAVGASMLGDKKYGVWLYAISLASSVIVGVFLKRVSPTSPAPTPLVATKNERADFARALTRAVSDAAVGMLTVCAFVVFFSSFVGALENALTFMSASPVARSLLFSFFELTSGLASISALSTPASLPLCALAVGWSGLSVHFQTMAICASVGSFRGYMLSHAARAAICALLALAVFPLLN